jgi:hypothetical protein
MVNVTDRKEGENHSSGTSWASEANWPNRRQCIKITSIARTEYVLVIYIYIYIYIYLYIYIFPFVYIFNAAD